MARTLTRCGYDIRSDEPGGPLLIEDTGCREGLVTVTNDVEAVVKQLHEGGHLPKGRRLFYIDSYGCKDELIHKNGRFVDFRLL
jgi:hypothetical protein